MPRKKKEVENTCPLCGEKYEGSLIPINFCMLEGQADWNIPFSPRVRMCNACARDFNNVVRAWYKKRNKTNVFNKPWVKI